MARSSLLISVLCGRPSRLWSAVTRRVVVLGLATVLSFLALTGCDEPNQVYITVPPPYAGTPNPAGAERVLAAARVRLGEHGFVHQGGEASEQDGEVWVWHEGSSDSLETRLESSDKGITITLRQITGQRGPEFNAMLHKLSGVVRACMTLPSSPAGSGQTRP
jgi:hypothetical protein